MDEKRRTLPALKVLSIVAAIAAAAFVVFLILPIRIKSRIIPRITASLTICDNGFEKVYKFSDPGDTTGGVCWEITELEYKPRISMSWKLGSYIKSNFRAEHSGDEWIISGTVHLRGNQKKEYSYSIPYDDSIWIVIQEDELQLPTNGSVQIEEP